MMTKVIKMTMATVGLTLLVSSTYAVHATEVILFNETFDNVTDGFSGDDPRRFGIPTMASFNSDENWYGARFENADGGDVVNDVGVQQFGGAGNLTPTSLMEDDAGMIFSIDASLYTDIVLEFDWRTFSAEAGDRVRVGYFIGDITAGNAGFSDRVIDLRSADQGGTDGSFNWNQGWIELASFAPNGPFSSEMFDLTAAAGEAEVWIGFWLDGGEGDFAKLDNIKVTAQVVPVPGAVWLLGSAMLGMLGLRRRNS